MRVCSRGRRRAPKCDDGAMSSAPRTRNDLTFVELDGESVVYDERSASFHRLNASATIVWSLCDGTMSEEAIAATIARSFDIEAEALAAQVRETLEIFENAGLLETVSAV